MSETKTKTQETEESTTEDTGEGDKLEATEIVKQQSERIKELETERDKKITEDAKKQLGGRAEAGKVPEPKKKLTDAEYADAYDKGEVDPFSDSQ